jgi:hypothetical protein
MSLLRCVTALVAAATLMGCGGMTKQVVVDDMNCHYVTVGVPIVLNDVTVTPQNDTTVVAAPALAGTNRFYYRVVDGHYELVAFRGDDYPKGFTATAGSKITTICGWTR